MSIDREQIIKMVRSGEGRLSKRDLVRKLGISGDERRDLRNILKDLTDEGLIIRTDRKTYRSADMLPNVMVLIIDHIDDHGDLIALPARWEGTGAPPSILVNTPKSHKKTAVLGVGTRALCKLSKKDIYHAQVIKVLGDGPRRELGVVTKDGRGLLVRPVKKGARNGFRPQRGAKINAQDLVKFEVTSARHKGERIARIVEVVGNVKQPKAASLISLFEHNIPTGFTKEERAQAKALSLPSLDKYRKDIRDLPLITIDPDDAKDFDDAIFARADDSPKNKGGHIVWVAIADVAAYIPPGSALDKGAFRKGNSVYLPDRVEPMLPEELSADLCSLRPHEDRACLAVRMVFDADGVKRSHKFVRGLMRSHARLTYAQAQAGFNEKPGPEAKSVLETLTDIFKAYKALRDARARRAPLEIDMPERQVKVDAKGRVASIILRERFDAHKLVEEFMIQANVAAAQALDAKNAEMIFRVHEPPGQEKVKGLSDFLPALNLKWSMGERPTARRFNRLMKQAKDKDLEETVAMSVLRTQMKAFYTPKNAGHFGLSLNHYTHFTSPIRRYADLIVHRALIKTLGLGEDGSSAEELSRLKEISEHISETERQAMAAERDAKDRYIADFLKDRIGAEFSARIAGVTRAGLFVTLDETGADGFLPASRLGYERFLCDEKTKSLVGVETGATYKFGRRVQVRLLEAMPLQGGLVFEMLSEPEKGNVPKRSARQGAYGRGGKHRPRKSKNRRRK